ncbi:RagB/SusD family nutrient uptake outer membrane protein [Seonamhaeicola marinus]|uniref:RagB/SusD family nutrient uptake outer membrane protein n=1 Tax=Seonamhaeicola marinus TaxID=1912246 RepID=A0A5D0IMC4_9FLAO|nr:RagB/SusD family nutrient uptake outer membrane protein [Seonamhaeicola marinus]TYA84179.1 RagB/SusD family nutrient uptake outer membrane protein [Seonamhaeicola marinus]
MKKLKIKISITALALLGVVGIVNVNCSDDVLNQVNPNELSPDTFWQSEDDAEKGIIGAYSPFTHIWYYTRFEIFISDYRDDVVNGYNTSERTAVGYFSGTSDSNATRWCWQAMYQGVARANEAIKHVPNINMDATRRDNILGEAYFIRAFNYFNLLNSWRNVPLITVPTSEVDLFTVTQASPEEVWAQIESDLQQAKSLLPDSWPSAQVGRATAGAATGYLGKAYLYQGKWAEAKAEFQSVMSSGNYQLMDDYAHNFTEEFENNSESLFEIQLVADGLGGWGADAPNRGKGAAYQPDLAPAGYTGQDGMRVNQWALDLFLDEQTINGEIDPRTFTTFFWNTNETTDYQGKTLESRTYLNTSYAGAYNATATEIYANKFLDWEFNGHSGSQDGGWHGSGNNLRMMRYADVLLMFAEAEFQLNGSTQAALDAINEVRERADMAPHASITLQDIEDERVKELTFERSRYFDLLRWGRVKSRIVDNPDLKSESAGTAAYKPGREYIAIPQNDVDRNPNLDQNEGY